MLAWLVRNTTAHQLRRRTLVAVVVVCILVGLGLANKKFSLQSSNNQEGIVGLEPSDFPSSWTVKSECWIYKWNSRCPSPVIPYVTSEIDLQKCSGLSSNVVFLFTRIVPDHSMGYSFSNFFYPELSSINQVFSYSITVELPSNAVARDALKNIESDSFDQCYLSWMASLGGIANMTGYFGNNVPQIGNFNDDTQFQKTIHSYRDKINGGRGIHGVQFHVQYDGNYPEPEFAPSSTEIQTLNILQVGRYLCAIDFSDDKQLQVSSQLEDRVTLNVASRLNNIRAK